MDTVTAEEVDTLEGAQFWRRGRWLSNYVRLSLPVLSQNAARRLNIDLANLAIFHGCRNETRDLLNRAANCVIGYGWRKDPAVFDLLYAIEACVDHGVGDVRGWLTRLAPSMEKITEYTDGDGTDHARLQFIELVARAAPDVLPALYRRQVRAEEWRYADRTLQVAVSVLDLAAPEAQALVGTLSEAGALDALRRRAEGGDVIAATLWVSRRRT